MKAGCGNIGDTVRVRCTVRGKTGRKGTIVNAEGMPRCLYTVVFSGGFERKFVSCDLELAIESR